jgi:TPR repeat protein
MELIAKAAELGFKDAHCHLDHVYHEGGDFKKAKFHYEAAAMAGHEVARCNLGQKEAKSRNMEQAVKHFTIGASAGCHYSMHRLIACFGFGHGLVSRESINSTLISYNNSCAEMRSEARDACIQFALETL